MQSGQTPDRPAALILAWYDRHHRAMPWRVPPAMRARGVRPDPYHVWQAVATINSTGTW